MKKLLPLIVAVCVVAVWGETFVSSKILLEKGLMPADIFFLRFSLAYVLIWTISPRKFLSDSWKDELSFIGLGVMGGSLYFLSENTALRFSTASNVAILVGSAPLITALLLAVFYKSERMNRRQIAGSIVAFLGMVMIILNGELVLHLNPLGDALAIGAALTWGFYSLFITGLNDRYDTRFITRKVFGYGVLTIIPYFLFVQPLTVDMEILRQPVVWGNLLYLSVVASLLCFILWNWTLAKLGTVRATNVIYCQAFFTMVVAWLVLGERITWMAVAGTFILLAGMAQAVRKF